MPRPIARATATLRLRTSSSSRATAPPPIRNLQLTSNGYSAEHENLAYRGGLLLFAHLPKSLLQQLNFRKTNLRDCLKSPNRPQIEALQADKTGQNAILWP